MTNALPAPPFARKEAPMMMGFARPPWKGEEARELPRLLVAQSSHN